MTTRKKNKEDFEQFFSEKGPDPWRYKKSGFRILKHGRTLELIKQMAKKNLSILELGAGDGVFTPELLPYAKKIDASDISEKAVEYANKKFSKHKQVNFVAGDCVTDKSLFSKKYDLVLVMEVINYLGRNEVKQLLSNCYNALKKEGHFIISHRVKPYKGAPGFSKEEMTHKEFKYLLEEKFTIIKAIPLEINPPGTFTHVFGVSIGSALNFFSRGMYKSLFYKHYEKDAYKKFKKIIQKGNYHKDVRLIGYVGVPK